MIKKLISSAVLIACSSTAMADAVIGVGYTRFDESQINLGAALLTVGYEFGEDKGFSLVPEVSLGVGVGDDTACVYGRCATVEIDRYVEFALRGEYVFDSNAYLFLKPSYGNQKVKATYFGREATASASEFGIGGGAGFHVSESAALEFFYQKFDDTNVMGLGLRFSL